MRPVRCGGFFFKIRDRHEVGYMLMPIRPVDAVKVIQIIGKLSFPDFRIPAALLTNCDRMSGAFPRINALTAAVVTLTLLVTLLP